MTKKKPSFIDLFSGAGGLSLGFIEAGYEHKLGVEIDPKMAETYQKNIGKVLLKDIKKIKGKDLPKVDIIVGGPPCQGFSSSNRKVWNERKLDSRQNLIYDFSRIILEKEPKVFLMENAPTLMSSRFEPNLNKFKKQLSKKYDVKCEIIDLGDIANLPQKRRRTICIGKKKNLHNK